MAHDIEANMEANKYYHAFLRVRSRGRSHAPNNVHNYVPQSCS